MAKGQKEQPAAEGLRYIGDGEWIPGVPARDLSAEEAAEFGERIAACEGNTGRTLYARVEGSEVEG